MDDLKKGDVVRHLKKNYIGIIDRVVKNEHKDVWVKIIWSPIKSDIGNTLPSNQSRFVRDIIGALLYG